MATMMKCGHASQGTVNGQVGCVICGCIEADPAPPALEGRLANCSYAPGGGKYGKCPPSVPSSSDLAFFEHLPTEEFDKYYCGCWGWD